MATLTVQSITESGLDATYANAASGGDTFANDSERIFVHVKNSDSASHTVTVAADVSETTRPGFGVLQKNDIYVAIPANENRFIGPFPRDAFTNNPDIQYDAVTGVTIAAIKI